MSTLNKLKTVTLNMVCSSIYQYLNLIFVCAKKINDPRPSIWLSTRLNWLDTFSCYNSFNPFGPKQVNFGSLHPIWILTSIINEHCMMEHKKYLIFFLNGELNFCTSWKKWWRGFFFYNCFVFFKIANFNHRFQSLAFILVYSFLNWGIRNHQQLLNTIHSLNPIFGMLAYICSYYSPNFI